LFDCIFILFRSKITAFYEKIVFFIITSNLHRLNKIRYLMDEQFHILCLTRLLKPNEIYASNKDYIVNLKSYGTGRSSERPKHANDISGKRDIRSFAAIFLEGYSASTSRFLQSKHHHTFLEDLTCSSGGEIFNVSRRDERK